MAEEISLKKIIGEKLLNKVQDTYLKYLESSAAVYEVNGDYAAALFSSKYCNFLNQASRKLAGKTDDKALKSGNWICHEDCWATSLESIKDKKPCEIECSGGIKIYAVPIIAEGMVIGSNNAGVSNPPTDEKKINEIAQKYKVDPKELLKIAKEYTPRPDYVLKAARNHILVAAETIAEILLRKRAEESLRNSLEELEKTQSFIMQSEKMASIGQLVAGVAHEINNSTSYITLNLGTMSKYVKRIKEFFKGYENGLTALKNKGNEDIDSFLAEMDERKKELKIDFVLDDFKDNITESLEGTDRTKKIVSDLKRFSHVDQDELKPADINEGLESTLNVVWNELKYKCTVEKDYGDLPLINCNHGQLNQAFMNLLVNAAQAIEKQGTITVSTRYLNGRTASSDTNQGYIEVKISDTGSGIPKDKLNRIFDPFFTTKDVGKGTGLGLSVAYDIIQKHMGEIKVQSEVGMGTTFTIQLPIFERL